MGKTRTFADKMIKEKGQHTYCPVCGAAYQPVRTLVPMKNEATGYFKFRDRIVQVCKCNHKEVYEA